MIMYVRKIVLFFSIKIIEKCHFYMVTGFYPPKCKNGIIFALYFFVSNYYNILNFTNLNTIKWEEKR